MPIDIFSKSYLRKTGHRLLSNCAVKDIPKEQLAKLEQTFAERPWGTPFASFTKNGKYLTIEIRRETKNGLRFEIWTTEPKVVKK